MKKIIVDVGGADAGPEVMIKGAMEAAGETGCGIILAGDRRVIEEAAGSAFEIIDAPGTVTAQDNPAKIIKGMEDTSMVRALEALKSRDDIIGMVSAGSTGCLLVGASFRLGLFKGLLQPALSSALPKDGGGWVCLLDCGANLGSRVRDLQDWARMGSAYMEAVKGTEMPRVGLVNVGREPGKGTDLYREAYAALLADTSINFIGNIEGSDILSGEVDVAVCDGFTGNVLLKGLEAAGKLAAKMADSKQISDFFNYNSLGGATFLGTKKIVVKAHGAADELTVKSCIRQVWNLSRGSFIEKMAERFI